MGLFKQWVVHVTPGYVYRANLQRLRRMRPFVEVHAAGSSSKKKKKKKKAKTPTRPTAVGSDRVVHSLGSTLRGSGSVGSGRAMHF